MTALSTLLTAERAPLKIYLDGFAIPDFLKTTNLIANYGGVVTRPDYETVVLSLPAQLPGTGFLRFHVNWLYDSIKSNKLQDVGRYLLPPVALRDSFTETPSISSPEYEQQDNVPAWNAGLSGKPPEAAPKSSGDGTQRNTKSADGLSHRRRREPLQPTGNHNARSFQRRSYPGMKSPRVRPQLMRRRTAPRNVDTPNSPTKSINRRWTDEENQKIVRYFAENALSGVPKAKIWEMMVESGIFDNPHRTAQSLQQHTQNYIVPNSKKFVSDPELLKILEALKPRSRGPRK